MNEPVSGELMRREAERSGAERVEWKSEKWGLSYSICALSSFPLASFSGALSNNAGPPQKPTCVEAFTHSSAERSFFFTFKMSRLNEKCSSFPSRQDPPKSGLDEFQCDSYKGLIQLPPSQISKIKLLSDCVKIIYDFLNTLWRHQ